MSKITHCEYEVGEFFIEMDYRHEGAFSTIKVTRQLVTAGKIDPGYGVENIVHDRINELPPAVVADYNSLQQTGFLTI